LKSQAFLLDFFNPIRVILQIIYNFFHQYGSLRLTYHIISHIMLIVSASAARLHKPYGPRTPEGGKETVSNAII